MDAGAFDALRDQPTRYDPFSVALWNRERERLLETAYNTLEQNPEIAVAVVVLNGGDLGSEATGGALAAPIARAVVEAAFR